MDSQRSSFYCFIMERNQKNIKNFINFTNGFLIFIILFILLYYDLLALSFDTRNEEYHKQGRAIKDFHLDFRTQ